MEAETFMLFSLLIPMQLPMSFQNSVIIVECFSTLEIKGLLGIGFLYIPE